MTTDGSSAHADNTAQPTAQAAKQWTPELVLQAFKEGVTALIGLLLVLTTVYLAWQTHALARSNIDDKSAPLVAQKVAWTKDILIMVLGPAGVVLGYYFGRVPADAHAAQAQKQADAATAHSQQVSAHAEAVGEHVDEVLGRVSTNGTEFDAANARGSSSSGVAPNVSELQRLRDELRQLAKLARTRI